MAVYQTLTLKEKSVDTLANTSQVQILWKSQQTGESHNDNTRTAKYWITVNGTKTEYTVSYTLPAKTTKTILNKTVTVPHTSDGTGTVKVQTWMDTRISAGEVELNKSLTLTPIPNASTVGATDAFVESTSLVAVARKSEAYTHSIAYTFGELTGFLDESGAAREGEVRMTATSIPFRIPASFYAQMPDTRSKQCQLICRTYQGDTQVGSEQSTLFTVTANEALCKPQVQGSVADGNPATLALTGDENVLVRHLSTARCTLSAQAKNSASIESTTLNGRQTAGILEIPNVQSGVFTFSARDSRGFTGEEILRKTMIPYVPVTLNAKVTRTDPTSGKGILEVAGQCFDGNFGARENVLTLTYSINGAPAETARVTMEDGGYTLHREVTGLTYTITSTIEITVSDLLTESTASVAVKPGIPVFDWGQRDFSFHVPVSMGGCAVKNLKNPAENRDAVNKAYADTKLAAVKLWENPDATVSFEAQTIPLELQDVCGVFVCFKEVASGQPLHVSGFLPMDVTAWIHCHGIGGELRQRTVSVQQTGISFGEGCNLSTQDNAYTVPVAIYGFRGIVKKAICGMFLCGERLAGQ